MPVDAPFLLLHGWMADATVWQDLVPGLDAAGRRFIVPNLAGADAPAQVVEAVAALDAVGCAEAVVVGHSMGGQVALALAVAHPERVLRLVLLCPVPPGGLRLPEPVAAFFRGAGGDARALGAILDQACRELTAAARQRLVDAALRIPPARLVDQLDAWTGGLAAVDPATVRAPTTVIATDDPFLPPELLRREVVDRVPGASLDRLPGPGHYPQVERPAAVLDRLLRLG